MKALSRAIDRFCLKHRKFGVPRLMLYIVLVSATVFIIHQMDTTGGLLNLLAFHPGAILAGQVWRLFTWIFLPLNSNFFFTVIMLYFYYFIGSTLEREWGTAKFTVYYLFGFLLNIVYGFIMWFVFNSYAYLAPNYLNVSMFFAFAVLFPDHVVRLFFIIPIKVKWMAIINAAFFAYAIIADSVRGNVAAALLPLIAILNFFIICGDDVINYLRPQRMRNSAQAINFRKVAKKAKHDLKSGAYRHKCAVCGKTDTDYPDLEFRYCSRCNGYHCFCIEHINNHVHFQ